MENILIFGNCQSGLMHRVLRDTPTMTAAFNIMYHELNMTEDRQAVAADEMASCDILLVQDSREWRHYPLRDAVPATARVIRFPFYYFGPLWPFDCHQNKMDHAAVRPDIKPGFAYQDYLLGELRTQVPDPVERFRVYRTLDMPNPFDIARYAELETARLQAEDERYGLDIGQFIIDNYKTVRMFDSITHMAPALSRRFVETIMKKAGISVTIPEGVNLSGQSPYQVPIHPKVVETLGLTWLDDSMTYNFHNIERLTFDQYYQRYIELYG